MDVTSLLIAWLSSALALWLTAVILPGFEIKNGFKGAAVVALVLGLLQAVLSWLVFGIIVVGTLGLALVFERLTQLFVMTILLVLTDKISDTLKIRSFLMTLVGAVLVTIGTDLFSRVITGVIS